VEESEKLFEMASDIWQSRMDGSDFHEAILTGMAAYILLRAKGSERLAPGALGLVHVAIEASEGVGKEPNHELNCSFCQRREPEVKLAAGPNAFICHMCVESLGQVFNNK
jgi:hypothetical protein